MPSGSRSAGGNSQPALIGNDSKRSSRREVITPGIDLGLEGYSLVFVGRGEDDIVPHRECGAFQTSLIIAPCVLIGLRQVEARR